MPVSHNNSTRDSLRLNIECQPKSTLGIAHIVVPASIVNIIYKEAVQSQKHKAEPSGFSKDKIPFEYINQHYRTQIIEHLKEFILKYLVISFLYQEMRRQKIITVGDPRLQNISLQIDQVPGPLSGTETNYPDIEKGVFHFYKHRLNPVKM